MFIYVVLHYYNYSSKVPTYSRVMVVQEAVTDKLQRDGGLADAPVAEHHNLVDAEAARRARSLARHAAACLASARARAAPATPFTRPHPSPAAQTPAQH